MPGATLFLQWTPKGKFTFTRSDTLVSPEESDMIPGHTPHCIRAIFLLIFPFV